MFGQDDGKPVKVQVDSGVKTMKSGSVVSLVELGKMESYGRDHLCGVVSSEIGDTSKVQRHITLLENMDVSQRVKWFEDNFPGVSIMKIDARLIDKDTRAAVITGSFQLKWGK